jgi:hypothetical protein
MLRGETLEILIARPQDIRVAKETCPENASAVNSLAPRHAEIAQR